MAKIPDAGLKWRNQGAGKDCREGTTKLGEDGGWRLGNAPPTCRRVVAAVEEKSCVWRCVTHWLSLGLLLVCRSGDDELNGGVIGRNGAVVGKVNRRVFPAL